MHECTVQRPGIAEHEIDAGGLVEEVGPVQVAAQLRFQSPHQSRQQRPFQRVTVHRARCRGELGILRQPEIAPRRPPGWSHHRRHVAARAPDPATAPVAAGRRRQPDRAAASAPSVRSRSGRSRLASISRSLAPRICQSSAPTAATTNSATAKPAARAMTRRRTAPGLLRHQHGLAERSPRAAAARGSSCARVPAAGWVPAPGPRRTPAPVCRVSRSIGVPSCVPEVR